MIRISEVFPSLTRRQREVCALRVTGHTAKQSAAKLGISPRTVEDHWAVILKAAEANNVVDVLMKLFGSPEVIA